MHFILKRQQEHSHGREHSKIQRNEIVKEMKKKSLLSNETARDIVVEALKINEGDL
jgi:hypothetical protein